MLSLATASPILPMPIMPSVFPLKSLPTRWVGLQPIQLFVSISFEPSIALRLIINISNIVRSAVASVRTSGVFVTVTLFSLHASKSIWLKPTP
ncbi:MAG: hypothetical protein CM15mP110_4970 [Alphaproteobacteria bacterium]|nr:MAG: hypothetical protein CM15mP110_4970 [Alphaproteobacteria bacterium]